VEISEILSSQRRGDEGVIRGGGKEYHGRRMGEGGKKLKTQ